MRSIANLLSEERIVPIANPDILRPIPLFHMLDEEELRTLAKELDEKHFLAGQKIFSMGDLGDKMYIVESGQVELFLQDKADDRVQLGVVDAGVCLASCPF